MIERRMGIDLGTTYSCVAIIEDGVPTVVPNEWGEHTHASVVSFMEDGRVLVGNDAKKQIITDPENTVYSANRLIGRFFFSQEVRKARSVMPYSIVEGPNNSVRIRIRDQMYSPSEVSAILLKEMRQIVENHTGDTITKAVITVPAFFSDDQRQAVEYAGKIAGLEVLRIINEPTAAALTYGFGQGYHQRVALYDLGGGTFDISILDIGDDVFEVISTAGDTYLGGDDFDDRIMHWLADTFQQQQGVDLRQDKFALQKLMEAAERVKIGLSEHEVVQIHIPLIYTDENGYSLDFSTTLSRAEFNQMVMDLVQRTFKVCDAALQSARITASDIDCVILVGGPTRLPIIRNSVRHYFQKQPLTDVDPNEVVAMGAAIQANSLVDVDGDVSLPYAYTDARDVSATDQSDLDPWFGVFPPRWAAAWGQDRFGLWAVLTVREAPYLMRWVPPGSFVRETIISDDTHSIGDSSRGKVHVSTGYWCASHPCRLRQSLEQSNGAADVDVDPALFDCRSWLDATEFCRRVSDQIDGLALRLPTGAELELAWGMSTNGAFDFPLAEEWCLDGASSAASHTVPPGDFVDPLVDPDLSQYRLILSGLRSDVRVHPLRRSSAPPNASRIETGFRLVRGRDLRITHAPLQIGDQLRYVELERRPSPHEQ